MARPSRNDQIVSKMEALALTMLEKVETKDEKINLDLQMDVFERIGKWVAIKNKLENDDGGGIADYKRRLQGAADKHPKRSRHETGGSRLDAFKSRIPRADDGDIDGDSGGAGGEIAAAAG